MVIGVRGHDYGKMEIEKLPEYLQKAGFEAAQIAPWKAFTEIDCIEDMTESKRMRIKAAFERWQIRIPVLGCYVDLGNPDDKIRQEAVARLCKCLSYSKEIGAGVVGTETSYQSLSREEKKIRFPYMIDSIKRVTQKAQELDAVFAVEPVSTHVLDSLDAVLQVMDQVGDKRHLQIIFDAVNVLEPDQVDRQTQYWEKWLQYAGEYICAMHVKDFTFNQDGSYHPAPLGTGLMEYETICSWLHANRPDMSLLREELDPAYADTDIQFLRNM